MNPYHAVMADYARDYQPLEKLKLEKYLIIRRNEIDPIA